jgi:hypothetical protein
MSLLMRNYDAVTGEGGTFLESVDGVSGGHEGGLPVDWFYFVNGVEAKQGAAANTVHAGDHVWWDRHAWSETDSVPAVVGSFPEPFLNGIEGKRLPVRVECADGEEGACRTVAARLTAAGAPAAIAAPGPGAAPLSLRVLIGRWQRIAGELGAEGIQHGPRASGVYARFSPDGTKLELLDPRGRTVHTLGPGAGLIAATRHGEDAPIWVVTGTDADGVARAAAAFRQTVLRNRFAVALGDEGPIALPDQEPHQ